MEILVDRRHQALTQASPAAEEQTARRIIVDAPAPEDVVVVFEYQAHRNVLALKNVCLSLDAADVAKVLRSTIAAVVVEPWARSGRVDESDVGMWRYQARCGERAVSISTATAIEILDQGGRAERCDPRAT